MTRSTKDAVGAMKRRMKTKGQDTDKGLSSRRRSISSVAPIRRLTKDLLREVFLCCVDDDLEDLDKAAQSPVERSSLDVRRPPWVLTHVCKEWRDLAMDYPSIWRNIVVPILPIASSVEGMTSTHAISTIALQQSVSLLKKQVSQATSIPSGTLDVTLLINTDMTRHHEPILEALIPTSRRWRKLTLDLHPSYAEKAFNALNQTQGSVQSLEQVCVSFVKCLPIDVPASQIPGFLQFIRAAPALRRLSCPSAALRTFQGSLASIRDYESSQAAENYPCSENLDVLSRMPHLETCILSSTHHNIIPLVLGSSRLILQDLRRFVLILTRESATHSNARTFLQLFHFLKLPNLLDLKVIVRDDASTGGAAAAQQDLSDKVRVRLALMFADCAYRLRYLELPSSVLSGDMNELLDAVSPLHHLTHLVLGSLGVDRVSVSKEKEIFQGIRARRRAGSLPRLKVFMINGEERYLESFLQAV